MKKAHSRTSLSNVHSETQKLRRQNANDPSFAKRALASFSRDHWRDCRLNSLNSIGSKCCLEFVIFLQPMLRVTLIHDWVTNLSWFTTDSWQMVMLYLSLRYLITKWTWKPQSNLYKKISHMYYMRYWSKLLQLCIVSAFAYANSRHKNLYWPNLFGLDGWILALFFFASLWNLILSRSINMQKNNLANIQPSWSHTCRALKLICWQRVRSARA